MTGHHPRYLSLKGRGSVKTLIETVGKLRGRRRVEQTRRLGRDRDPLASHSDCE